MVIHNFRRILIRGHERITKTLVRKGIFKQMITPKRLLNNQHCPEINPEGPVARDRERERDGVYSVKRRTRRKALSAPP